MSRARKPRNERTRFKANSSVPIAERPISVRLPEELDEIVRSLPNRTEWLRDAITEKLEREEFKGNPDS